MSTLSAVSGSINDEELVDRIRDGDDRALGMIYDRHAGMVFSLARAIIRADSDAEEVSEAVFLHLWRNPERFEPQRGSLRTYLATVARSRAKDRVRSKRRRMEATQRSADAAGGQFAAPVSNPGSDPEDALERHEAQARLSELLGELTAEQREAIELAFLGGLTQREIADELGTPLGTVKTRIRDGMARLRAVVHHRGIAR